MDNKIEAILKEIRTNKSASTVTNPRFQTNETQNTLPRGSKLDKSIEVRASNNEDSESENEDYPLKANEMLK